MYFFFDVTTSKKAITIVMAYFYFGFPINIKLYTSYIVHNISFEY